ncbi:MAG: hypothetical protein ABUJ93_12940, partial [Hyphomicrobium sp.]
VEQCRESDKRGGNRDQYLFHVRPLSFCRPRVIRDEPPVLVLLASISEADHAGKRSLALFRTEQDKEILQLFFAPS